MMIPILVNKMRENLILMIGGSPGGVHNEVDSQVDEDEDDEVENEDEAPKDSESQTERSPLFEV